MAYVTGKSSLGRLGLVIAAATQIDPGFKGSLTLELANVGTVPIRLYPGLCVAQLIFHPVKRLKRGYSECYYLSTEPQTSGIYEKDRDLKFLEFLGNLPPDASQAKT
jgi:dCTP deaminase